MKLYTIGYIDHDQAVHVKYLGPSLAALEGEFDVISTLSKECPAVNYNNILERSKTPYVIFTHQDVTFPSDLLNCINNTIRQVPAFGALGMVGVDGQRNYLWSISDRVCKVDTLDCCFLIVRRDLDVKFDAKTFNEFHLYVEDYCGQVSRGKGLKCYTILAQAGAGYSFNHHSHTCSQRGYCWGNWAFYRQLLNNKYPGLQTT